MKIGFQLYSTFHNRPNTGSSRIRGDWLIKYWDEAEEFVHGRKYDAVIFQKIYDTKYVKEFDGIKILDMCDPDWTQLNPVIETAKYCDAITVPTKGLQKFLQPKVGIPVVMIPDRHDLEWYKPKRKHTGKAKEVCWYGYSHNSHCLKSLRELLRKHDMRISIIGDEPVVLSSKGVEVKERYTKWKLETINKEIIKSDFVVMPGSRNPNWKYKSNNKTISSWALNMPVACDIPTFEKFLDPIERQKEADKRLQEVKDRWDVKYSVEEMKKLIKELI